MRYCPSFLIVQLINQGFTPDQACTTAVKKMKDRHGKWFELGVIALNNQVCNMSEGILVTSSSLVYRPSLQWRRTRNHNYYCIKLGLAYYPVCMYLGVPSVKRLAAFMCECDKSVNVN